MAGTKRNPIARDIRARITSEILDAFTTAIEYRDHYDAAAGTGPSGCELCDSYSDCPERLAYLNAITRLHVLIGHKPWDESPIDADEDEPPSWLTMPDRRENYARARALRLQLEAALEAD